MKSIKIAVFGCGFWSQFQIGAWLELPEIEIVAVFNQTLERAKHKDEMFKIKKYRNYRFNG